MKRAVIAIPLSLCLVALIAVTAWVAGRFSKGGFQATYAYQEKLRFEGQSYTTTRKQVFVPVAYGKLINVTSGGNGTTLWYDNGKSLRNVIVDEEPVIIHRSGKIEKEGY